ncbi:MAG: hypothetical protein WAM14_05290 [Candidatus Nitrosopolaris sp.]
MLKTGEIEVVYHSMQAFYTLKDIKFTKMMTPDHTGVASLTEVTVPSTIQLQLQRNKRKTNINPIYRIIQNLPFNKAAVHDIRLRFKVERIWSVISNTTNSQINPVSKDIPLKREEINELDIRVTIHHTDTVSIVIGCSCSPV